MGFPRHGPIMYTVKNSFLKVIMLLRLMNILPFSQKIIKEIQLPEPKRLPYFHDIIEKKKLAHKPAVTNYPLLYKLL